MTEREPVARRGSVPLARIVGDGELDLDLGVGAVVVHAGLEALPLRAAVASAARSTTAYRTTPHAHLPMALADLHRALRVGAPLDLRVPLGDGDLPSRAGPGADGQILAAWSAPALLDVVAGAGFTVESSQVADGALRVAARRAHTLADTVGPGMRLLVCGLNPSRYSADRGVGYARPGNRFWKAIVAAGLVAPERALDPVAVLRHDGVGITDLVKRATVASAELDVEEYRLGAARVERLVARLGPRAVAFVGLEGWRAAVDRKAVAGLQPEPFGGRPAYVLPSTSGLNAHSRLDDLVAHFRAVRVLCD